MIYSNQTTENAYYSYSKKASAKLIPGKKLYFIKTPTPVQF